MSSFWRGIAVGYMTRAAFTRDSMFTDVVVQLIEKAAGEEVPRPRSAYTTFRPPYNRPRYSGVGGPRPPRSDIYYRKPLPGTLGHVFDESNENWSPNRDVNELYLRTQRNYFANLLKSRGHVFLNEVYDTLGFPRSRDGAVLGWLWELPGEDAEQDELLPMFSFATNENGSVDVHFNVDGIIIESI